MLLTFKRKYPWGPDTRFRSKIISGIKNHTFRIFTDQQNPNTGRWKPGTLIHFWDESPRNRFCDPPPEQFQLPMVKSMYWFDLIAKEIMETKWMMGVLNDRKIFALYQCIPVVYAVEQFTMTFEDVPGFENDPNNFVFKLQIGDMVIGSSPDPKTFLLEVANRDGFENAGDFIQWFNIARQKIRKKEKRKISILKGIVIHWTSNVYSNEAITIETEKKKAEKANEKDGVFDGTEPIFYPDHIG